jgi:hypothetical protein
MCHHTSLWLWVPAFAGTMTIRGTISEVFMEFL